MKKFIMTFLVAGLMITSALSLSSCKKTVTDASSEEWIPIVYDVISPEGNFRDGDETLQCPYHNICTINGGILNLCDDEVAWVDHCLYCSTHSHKHCFEATDDCSVPNQIQNCKYKGKRKHFHIVTYHRDFYYNGWHVGGGCGGMD